MSTYTLDGPSDAITPRPAASPLKSGRSKTGPALGGTTGSMHSAGAAASLPQWGKGPAISLNNTLKQHVQVNGDLRGSGSLTLTGLIPRMHTVGAPTTAMVASPLEDLFVMRAAAGDFEDVLRRLARGQDINVFHSQLKYTALHTAADQGQATMVRFLVNTGADITLVHEGSGDTVLHIAVAAGQYETMEELVRLGCDKSVANKRGLRPMDIALELRRPEAVRFLGVVPDQPTRLRMTRHTLETLEIMWKAPFSDGVWINGHELQMVMLDDEYLPGGQYDAVLAPEGSGHRLHATGAKPSPLRRPSSRFAPSGEEGGDRATAAFVQGAAQHQSPLVFSGGHFAGHAVTGLPPWTAYRCRVRVCSLVGWSAWSATVIVHTAGSVPQPPADVVINSHRHCDLSVSWVVPKANGSPIIEYALQILTLPAWVDEHGVVHRGDTADSSCVPVAAAAAAVVRVGTSEGAGSLCDFVDRNALSSLSLADESMLLDECALEVTSPVRSRKLGLKAQLKTTNSTGFPRRQLEGGLGFSSTGTLLPVQRSEVQAAQPPLPPLTRPVSHLSAASVDPPAPIAPIASLDYFHAYMWIATPWVTRPQAATRRSPSPNRSGPGALAEQTQLGTHLSTSSLMPFLPTASAADSLLLEVDAESLVGPLQASAAFYRFPVIKPGTPTLHAANVIVDTSAAAAAADWAHPVLFGTPTTLLRHGSASRLSTPSASVGHRDSPSGGAIPVQTFPSTPMSMHSGTSHAHSGIRRSHLPSASQTASQDGDDSDDATDSQLGDGLGDVRDVLFVNNAMLADEGDDTVLERPPDGQGWFNTGEPVPGGSAFPAYILDVASERDVFVRCFARNRFGWSVGSAASPAYWMPDCPSVLHATSTSLRITLGSGGHPPFQLQTQVCHADVWNGAPLDWLPPNPIPGYPHRADGYNDPPNDPAAIWIDCPVTDADNAVRAVTVSGLLPASRYRARVRCATVSATANAFDEDSGADARSPGVLVWPNWDLSPVSDWYRTSADLPDAPDLVHAASWEKKAMVVQWKLPRINGSLITHFRIERMRLRPNDDADSDSDSSASEAGDCSPHEKQGSDDDDGGSGIAGIPTTEFKSIGAVPLLSPAVAAARRGSSPAPHTGSLSGARGTPVTEARGTPMSGKGTTVGEPEDGMDEDEALAQLMKGAADVAAHRVQVAAKPKPVYDRWIPVVDDYDVTQAAAVAAHLHGMEDLVIGKLQGRTPEGMDAKLKSLLHRDGYAPTLRLLRLAAYVRTGKPLQLRTMDREESEPDVAWVVPDVRPGSHHAYRIAVRNGAGWSSFGRPSTTTRLNAMHPLTPDAPVVLAHSPTQLLVCWALPRSQGAPIIGFALERKRTLMSKHPDETDSDNDQPVVRTPFNGPLGRVKVYKPPKSGWCTVVVPDYVKYAMRVQEPLTAEELGTGGRAIALTTAHAMSLAQQQAVADALVPGRRWAYALISGFKPCSRHRFRVQTRNAFGSSKFGAGSRPGILPEDVPVKLVAPHPLASSFNAIILYWIEPCHNGNETLEYQIQRLRVYTTGPDDSESEPDENDSAAWLDLGLVDATDAIGSHRMTGAPDLVKLLGLRGKRRNGKRCSFPIAPLRPGKTYRFRIRARNELGWNEFSDESTACRTIASAPENPLPVIVKQHLPRMLRLCWTPPRSNGSLLSQVVLQRQMVTSNWKLELEGEVLQSGVAGDVASQEENMAWRMHPDSVSVLSRVRDTSGWETVPLSAAVFGGGGTTPYPTTEAEIWELPASPIGETLWPNRQYVDMIIDHLPPESVHRFRIKFSNARDFTDWSRPSTPCEVYGDWPDVIASPPLVVARSPFALYLQWSEPEGNGAPVLGYKVQRKRFRFKPKDPEPHPDDSDSAPEDGNYEEDWQDVVELTGDVARQFGKASAILGFSKEGAAGFERPWPVQDEDWFKSATSKAAVSIAEFELQNAAQLNSESIFERIAAEKGSYLVGQVVGWPVLGLRPGTRHMFRVTGKNYLGYPPFSPESVINATTAVFPSVPSDPFVCRVNNHPDKLFVKTVASRSNGAEIFEYDTWRQRIRGGNGIDDSDSEPEVGVDPEVDDSQLISVLSAAPDEFTTECAYVTSGHAGDKLRILIEGLKPGTRHRFRLRVKNTRGFSEWTDISNICQAVATVPLAPLHVTAYQRSSVSLHVTWQCPRSRGAHITAYQLQRRRLKGKHDQGVPSDDELEMLQQSSAGNSEALQGLVKSRRRMEGVMQDFYEHEWQELGVYDESEYVRVPAPAQDILYFRAEPTAAEVLKQGGRGVPSEPVLDEEVVYGMENPQPCGVKAVQERVAAVKAALNPSLSLTLADAQSVLADAVVTTSSATSPTGLHASSTVSSMSPALASAPAPGAAPSSSLALVAALAHAQPTGTSFPQPAPSPAPVTVTVTSMPPAAAALSPPPAPGMTGAKFRYIASDILLPNTTHELRVRAQNAMGWGEWSEPSAPMRTLVSRPYRPGKPNVSSGSEEPVIIRWAHARGNGAGIKLYELSCYVLPELSSTARSGAGGGGAYASYYEGMWDPPEDAVWVVQALVPGRLCVQRTVLYQPTMAEQRTYCAVERRRYRVRASNAHGWSIYSELSEVVTLTPTSCAEAQAEMDAAAAEKVKAERAATFSSKRGGK